MLLLAVAAGLVVLVIVFRSVLRVLKLSLVLLIIMGGLAFGFLFSMMMVPF